MIGTYPDDILTRYIRPTLDYLKLGGIAAEELMLGTALQESGGGYRLVQAGGPALGIWQMEPATHNDLWTNWIPGQSGLAKALEALRLAPFAGAVIELASNPIYACAMARLVYRRRPEPLPPYGDLAAQAAYYKQWYNTPLGAATVEEYIEHWRTAFPKG
jgi:hypothetical protein